MSEVKKLFRSKKNKMVAGVLGGLAEYFNIDATLVRVIGILIILFSGFVPGIVAYLILILIMPVNPAQD
ncbi:MAG: PspC domain-containing protein [Spirochaetales bacterium]|nr:PspC domain-containing protein [Spirochaetales bacterium]